MPARPLFVLLKWAGVLGILGSLIVGGYLIHKEMRAEREREASGEKVQSPRRSRDGVVDFDKENAERYGLEETTARAVQWDEQVPVYGRVVPNPRATTEIRSPFAGTLRSDSAANWPAPGQWIRKDQKLGWVEVRVGPEVLIDLDNKLRESELKEKGAEEVVKVQTGRVDSLQQVTDRGIIGRAELDAAQVQLQEARTQLATARAAAGLWRKAIHEVKTRSAGKESRWSAPLTAPAAGEVTELAARPGTAIEAGGLVLQLVDPSRPLVRLDFPAELVPTGAPAEVQLTSTPTLPSGTGGLTTLSIVPKGLRSPVSTLEARLVGPTPRVDVASQLVGFWYEAKQGGNGRDPGQVLWRPGLQVKALVRVGNGRSQPAVAVPADAVLYHEGRTLVYVRLEPGKYQRREVRLLGWLAEDRGDKPRGSWVVAPRQDKGLTGVAPGEAVVSRQAQLLLSEEARPESGAD